MAPPVTRNAREIESVSEVLKGMLAELQKNVLQELSVLKNAFRNDIEQLRGDIKVDLDQMKKELRMEFEQMRIEFANDSDVNSDEEDSSNSELQGKLDNFMADQGKLQQKLDMFIEDHERKARGLNLRLAGLPEENKEHLTSKVRHFVKEKMNIETHGITEAFRVGRVSDKPRHVIVKFESREHRWDVMRKRTLLRGTNVWVNEDLTREQYQTHMQDMTRLKEARQNGKKAYWRNGKVVIEEEEEEEEDQEWSCDGCSADILGRRWHCNVCPAFDFCETCYEGLDADQLPSPHSHDHLMIAID